MAMSTFEERMAQITPRSIAGSSTLIPPAIFKKTSFAPSLKPQRFSKTAKSIESLRKSKPVAER